ncbi:MAG: class C sortase [Clostridiales bacterium]|nr:class C sortase [Clostridiales bacterium]
MKKRRSTILLILVFLIGLSLLLYPSVSNYINSLHQSRAIAGYSETVAGMDSKLYQQYWDAAVKYNEALSGRSDLYTMSDAKRDEYLALLDITGTGMLGYLEIPSIDVSLPVYHGTSESVLQVAAGHLEWTSLPVGGESTHCVISGHRGLPSAKLFTNLDQLTEGDVFLLRVLDETLTYEVDQILIVKPEEISELTIVPGEDYCTLFTCTPYGVNTHRLLVRGHRVPNQPDAAMVRVTADAVQINPLSVTPLIAIPLLLLLVVLLKLKKRRSQS